MAYFQITTASDYPIQHGTTLLALNVFGLQGTITEVDVKLFGLTHSFWGDLDILLVGPDGTRNLAIWSDIGSFSNTENVSLYISDAGATITNPDGGIFSPLGVKPHDFHELETNDHYEFAGDVNHPGPNGAATLASVFNGSGPNGAWRLHITDDSVENDGHLYSWGLGIVTSSDVAAISGTGGNDFIVVNGSDVGTYSLNGSTVEFEQVASFELNGGGGNDTLNGGPGIETMRGGSGNDTYYVDNAGDIVIEGANGGTDTVISTVTQTISSGVNNLKLAGSGSINGTGNTSANTITGNGGNNILKGGAGNDILRGGIGTDQYYGQDGNDTFVFASEAETGSGTTRDIIRGFEAFGDDDTIDLSGFAGTLTFSNASTFSGAVNEVIAVQSGSDVIVRIYLDPNNAAEILLTNTQKSQITVSDFDLV